MLSRACIVQNTKYGVALFLLFFPVIVYYAYFSQFGDHVLAAPRPESHVVNSVRGSLNNQDASSVASTSNDVIPAETQEVVRPLIVLFTTFKVNKSDIRISNTLHEWASLLPRVQPVLYYTSNSTIKHAIARGWTTVKCPKMADSISPSCVLPAMFLDAQQRFPFADFYGYANGDILFNHSLIKTLAAVKKYLVYSSLLIVGCRFNYQMRRNETIRSEKDVTARKGNAWMFTGWAIDYFITPRNKYNWTEIPPLVVGRTLYDNFMISHSLSNDIPVLDATKTVLAMHQTLTDNYESRKGKKDNGINSKIISKHGQLPWGLGSVSCAQHVSVWMNNTVGVTMTEKERCKNKFDKLNIDISLIRNATVFRSKE